MNMYVICFRKCSKFGSLIFFVIIFENMRKLWNVGLFFVICLVIVIVVVMVVFVVMLYDMKFLEEVVCL